MVFQTTNLPYDLMVKLIQDERVHLTYSEKRLLAEFVPEICLKNRISIENFLKDASLLKILNAKIDPVQKGKKVFNFIRKMRYPLSYENHFPNTPIQTTEKERTADSNSAQHQNSKGVQTVDSRKKLVNPYYYGKGIHDLKEYVISLIRSCPLDCAYCFLREVYDDPHFKVPPDYSKIACEIRELREQKSGTLYLNAGENADSLILDMEYDLTQKLAEIVQPYSDTFLEFRSKTNKIQKLLKLIGDRRRTVTAFSLNPEEDRILVETNTSAIDERISAISELEKAGFSVGLRFEPIIYSETYKEKYRRLFEKLFSQVEPVQVHSLSLGCMRLTKGLAKMLRESHPRLLAEEWILGVDKKWRYYQGIRIEIYGELLQLLKNYFPFQERTVLSTEPPEIWREAGLPLKTMPEISRLLQRG